MTTPALTLDPSQVAACELVLTASVGVVTGGPGTGKSTSMRAALDAIDEKQPRTRNIDCPSCMAGSITRDLCLRCNRDGVIARHSYLLAAPTGKAARRISEVTGRDATTVHRLLDYGPKPDGTMGFRRDALRPIEADLVIVDEASMLDVELAAALVAAIEPEHTRLVLVGDVAQLPPVGPGRVFADVIESGTVPVARLTTLHRAAQESWVCTQSREVLEGRMPDLKTRHDFGFERVDDARGVVPALVRLVEECEECDNSSVPQVLIPQNPGFAGTAAANKALADALCPFDGSRMWTVAADVKLWRGLRVIQTVNDYTLDVMNGEQGVIASVGDTDLVVELEGGREVRYSRGQAERLRLAYALTVHKSQGSEWPWVVVVCHSTHTFSLSRALLYTAITRAKKGVILVGDVAGIERAVSNGRDAVRNSGLVERMRRSA